MAKQYPSKEYLDSILSYCPITGVIKWKDRPIERFSTKRGFNIFKKRYALKDAGCRQFTESGKEYVTIRIEKKLYLAHRIAWVMHYGCIDSNKEIDHINGNSSDNRIKNLRLCNDNNRNQKLFKNNKSGHAGVTWYKAGMSWEVKISKKYIGRFKKLSDAVAARKKAEVEHGFHKNHGSNRPL